MTIAEVRLWGRTIGAVTWNSEQQIAYFEYEHAFQRSGIELSPITMPLAATIYGFPALARATFQGLPGLLADTLPDRFGNLLIDTWLAREGRSPDSFNPVERLCYTGSRGMGALEFRPALGPSKEVAEPVDVGALVGLASEILTQRESFEVSLSDGQRSEALGVLLRVGTSAGGARAKAIIAWNPTTNVVRSGQVKAGEGFSYWLLKFDGVSENRDKELEDPQGFGKIEYAYSLMAKAAGIEMSECRLMREGGRSHFMTKRFDRKKTGAKLHMQSLGAIAHFDFNMAGAHSYEHALGVLRILGLPMQSKEQLFRRMLFNVVARNQDDHVKNIAFLMDPTGAWSLAPAFDVTYSYNPQGRWTGHHQMSIHGKRDDFCLADFQACAQSISLKHGRARTMLAEVVETVAKWPEYAAEADVPKQQSAAIGTAHRLAILSH